MTKYRRLVVLLVLMGVGYLFSKSAVDQRLEDRGKEKDVRYIPNASLAQCLALGYEPSVADLYWIEALNYYGSELMNKNRSYEYLEDYSNLIFSLDPYFESFYEWAATAFIYTGLKIDRSAIVKSTRYVNLGIQNLEAVGLFTPKIIVKGAFNYALEAHANLASIPYFTYAARSDPQSQLEMFLVGSAYAAQAYDLTTAANLKLEYLGEVAFRARNREEIRYALQVLTSPRMNSRAAEFVRSLRIKMETDEEVRKLIEKRLSEEPVLQRRMLSSPDLFSDRRLDNVLSIDFSRTWLKPDMLMLLSL